MSGIKLETLTNAIEALSITGLTITDIDNINDKWEVRELPVLFPLPIGFITNLVVTRLSQGTMAQGAKKNVEYTLTYRLCYAKVGGERINMTGYAGLIAMVVDILDKIIDNDTLTGIVDITPGSVTVGMVYDGASNQFWGADLTFNVLEFYEV